MSLNLDESINIHYQNFAEAIAKYANPPPTSNPAADVKAKDESAGF